MRWKEVFIEMTRKNNKMVSQTMAPYKELNEIKVFYSSE